MCGCSLRAAVSWYGDELGVVCEGDPDPPSAPPISNEPPRDPPSEGEPQPPPEDFLFGLE